MTSSLGSRTRSGETSPQVRPNTTTSCRPFASQLRLQFSRHCGVLALSDRITFAPHLAATTPGRLTPAPSCGERPQSVHSSVAGQVFFLRLSNEMCSFSPPAPSCLSALVCVSTDTEPAPLHKATHTSHIVHQEPESEHHSLTAT